jgi:hypothetical protein
MFTYLNDKKSDKESEGDEFEETANREEVD